LFKKYIWVAVVCAAVLAAMGAFTPTSEWPQMGAILGVMVVAIAAQLVPAARRFVLGHRRSTIAVGVGAIGVALFVLFSTLSSSSVDPEVGGTAAAFLMLVGSLVIALPFMAKRMEKDTAAWKVEAAAPRTPGAFRADAEVKDILAELIDQRGALFRVIGPWFLLFCALPMVLINVDYWKGLADQSRGMAMMILLGLVIVVIAELGFLFVAMIQWTRFVATKEEPRLAAFPGKALWGWAWRWVIYGAIIRSVDRIEPWLKEQLPDATQWQLDGVQGLIGLGALVLFSPFGLVLPAVALNAADKGISASMRGFRVVGRKFYLGAILIIGPYAVASWVLGMLSNYKQPAVVAASVGASLILLFGTTIVGMTYLTRVYLRGATGSAIAT
jgi:hypothetical protein